MIILAALSFPLTENAAGSPRFAFGIVLVIAVQTLIFFRSIRLSPMLRGRWQPWQSPSVGHGLASNTPSNGLIRPEGRQRPRSPSRNSSRLLFSPAAKRGIPRAKSKKQAFAVLRWRCGPQRLRADRSPGQGQPSRLRWTRPEQQRKITMANIGTFTASDNGLGHVLRSVL